MFVELILLRACQSVMTVRPPEAGLPGFIFEAGGRVHSAFLECHPRSMKQSLGGIEHVVFRHESEFLVSKCQ